MTTSRVTLPVEVRVYGATGTGTYVTLPRRSGVRFMEELNGLGSGEVTVPLDDQVLKDHPGLLDYGAVVKFAQPNYWNGAMVEVAAFVVEAREYTIVTDAPRQLHVSGRGLKAWLENGLVLPFDGYTTAGGGGAGTPQPTTPSTPSGNRNRQSGPSGRPDVVPVTGAAAVGQLQRTDLATRYAGWMSATSWWIDGSWVAAMGVAMNDPSAAKWRADDYGNPIWGPDNWPDKDAQWIWPPPGPGVKVPAGRALFRATLTLTAPATVNFFAAGDDTLRLFIDEQQLAEGSGWTNTYTAQLNLDAGDHIVAANVDNHFFDYGDNDPTHDSPGGLMFTAIDADTGTVLLRSDPYSWLSAGAYSIDATDLPGPTAAGTFIELLAEAADRGAAGVTQLTRDFSNTVDSAGFPWLERHERSFQVGTDLLNVADQLAESSFDVRVTPDLVVHAHRKQGDDWYVNDWQVQLQAGMNLVTYNWTENGNKPRTSLVAHDQQGWYTADSAPGQSQYGRIEGFVEAGNSASPFETRRLLDATLPDLAKLDHVATAELVSVQGMVPLWDFAVGDIVAAPDANGALTPMEVLSISAEENDPGSDVLWSVELRGARTPQAGAVRLAARSTLRWSSRPVAGGGLALAGAAGLSVTAVRLTWTDEFAGTGALDPDVWAYGATGQFTQSGGYAHEAFGGTVVMANWGGAVMHPLDGNRRIAAAFKFNGSTSAALLAVAAKGSDPSALFVRFGSGSGTAGTVGVRYFNPGGSYLTPSGWTDVAAPAGYQGSSDAGFNTVQVDYYPGTNRIVVVVNGTATVDQTFTTAPWAGHMDQTGHGVGILSQETLPSQLWDYVRVVGL